ncbi:TonB family protein [Tabrizicola sp.]|uniref:energy transducer TonB family protein n=1 Tax=Tabrizicola sp. TaxID=2005166 RepID=UPI003D2B5FD7
MNASSPLDLAFGQPCRAVGAVLRVPGAVAHAFPQSRPLVASAPLPARPAVAIVPRRDAPQGKAAPKICAPLPVLPVVEAPARRAGLRGAALVSTALHLGLVAGWAVFAAPARPLIAPDLEAAEVSLLSEAQFLAMTAPQPQLAMAAPPMLEAPAPEVSAETAAASMPEPALSAELLSLFAPDSMTAPQPFVAPDSPALPIAPLSDLAVDAAPKADVPPIPAPVAEPAPKAAKVAMPKKPATAAAPAEKPAKASTNKAPVSATKSATAAVQAAAAAKPALNSGQAKKLTADWGAKVRARINRKVALPANTAPGTVKVRLELAPSGALLSVGIAQSSGQAALDAAAIKAVKSAAPFARAPKGLSEASYSFSLPITFKS